MTWWEILGIEATKDKDLIKAAYRKKLSNVNPEDDPEGFMTLRRAFEQATAEADQTDTKTGTVSDFTADGQIASWIAAADALYQSFFERIDAECWKPLLDADICVRLDAAEEMRDSFLRYLLAHSRFPNRVWKLFDRTFSLVDDADELKEKFPEDFIEYVVNAVTYEGVLDYDLFSGPADADYDRFIERYFMVRYQLELENDDEAGKLLDELASSEITHPYLAVEQGRLLMHEGKAEEARDLLAPVSEKYADSEYILYFYGQSLMMCDEDAEAEKIFKKIPETAPEHYLAAFSTANLHLKQGQYRLAKEEYLSLIEVDEHDESVLEKLQEANRYLIPEYRRRLEENPDDCDTALELGWCLCQNEAYEECLRVLSSVQADEEHLYDEINLRGRVLLCLNRFEESLPYLLKWREMILSLEDDGTEKTKKRMHRLGYANYAIAMCYACQENADYARALSFIEMAIETEENVDQRLNCYYAKADILKRQGHLTEAVDVCTSILEMEKRFYPALVLRQECYKLLGYGVDVIRDYRTALSLYPGGERPYELAAEVLLDAGETDMAGDVLKQAGENHVETLRIAILWLRLRRKRADSEALLRGVIDGARDLLEKYDEDQYDHALIAEVYVLMALCYCDLYMIYERDVLDAALECIGHALRLNPSDSDCLNIEAYICSKKGNTKRALEIYRQLLADQPDDCYYLFRIAAVYGERHELDKALSYYQRVLEQDEHYPEIHREIGIIYREMAQDRRQRSYYRMAVEAFDRQLAISESQYDLIERGRLYMELGMYEAAESDFNRTLELNRDNIYAYNALGDVCRYRREYRQAVKWYQAGIDHIASEGTPVLYENLAQCYECLGEFETAGRWYESALALYPNRPRLYEKYASYFEHLGKYEEAREIFLKGQENNPAFTRYFNMQLARMYENFEHKEAFRIYRHYYRKNARDIRAIIGIGRCYLFCRNKPKKALDYYMEGMRIAAEDQEAQMYREGCLGAGLACERIGDKGDAAVYFREAISSYREIYPDILESDTPVGMDAGDYYAIGRLFALYGDLERAAKYFEGMLDEQRCCESCRRCSCYEYLMGRALLAYFAGDTAGTVRLYKQAAEIAVNDAECKIALRQLGQG